MVHTTNTSFFDIIAVADNAAVFTAAVTAAITAGTAAAAAAAVDAIVTAIRTRTERFCQTRHVPTYTCTTYALPLLTIFLFLSTFRKKQRKDKKKMRRSRCATA